MKKEKDYILFKDGIKDIAKNYEISYSSLNNYIHRGIKSGFITAQELNNAMVIRYSANGIKGGKRNKELGFGIHGMTPEQRREIDKRSAEQGIGIYSLSAEQRGKIGKRVAELGLGVHGRTYEQMRIDGIKGGKISGKRNKELGLGVHGMTYEQRKTNGIKGGKRSAELGVGIHGQSKEQKTLDGIKGGIKVSEQLRKNAYHLEGRFHTSSQQEGAVALLLEKYISEYQVKDGQNFQVRNNGINNGGIDFLVNDEFLEWHPTILGVNIKDRRGDIPKEEMPSYLKVRASLPEEERKQFEQDYKEVLETNYFNRRKSSIRNSGYTGLELNLARTPEELYQFIARHSTSLPSFDEFKTEFNQKVKYVKGFKVEKQDKTTNKTEDSKDWAFVK